MKKYIKSIFITIGSILISFTSFWQISLNIIPQKYDLLWTPWESITKTVQVKNNTNQTISYYVVAKDFIPNNINWSPNWINEWEYIPPQYQPYLLSKRIQLSITWFTLNPWEEKVIPFTINIPSNAIPWTYYWWIAIGILPSNNITWSNFQIWVIGEIATIVLLTIPWEIKTEATVWWIYIETPDTISTKSNINKNDISEDKNTTNNQSKTDSIQTTTKPKNQFTFKIEFENKWNTYIKPIWKIEIYDEKWQKLKNIWKETIIDKQWRVIGSKIVDYVPINDVWGAVLPNSKRYFEAELKWFFVRHYSPEKWDYEYKILPLETYCQQLNTWTRKYLYFWEIEKKRKKTINLYGKVQLSYTGLDGKWFNFNTWLNLQIECEETYIDINWPLIWIILWIFTGILSLIILLLIIAFKRKDKRNKVRKNE